jgi:hypothetical protein
VGKKLHLLSVFGVDIRACLHEKFASVDVATTSRFVQGCELADGMG